MTKYKCPYCGGFEIWEGTIEKSYPCYNCGKHFLLPNQDLMVAKEVEEYKYPGAWYRGDGPCKVFTGDEVDKNDHCHYNMDSHHVIEAITGSRLLNHILRESQYYIEDPCDEGIANIMKDHDKMLKESEE